MLDGGRREISFRLIEGRVLKQVQVFCLVCHASVLSQSIALAFPLAVTLPLGYTSFCRPAEAMLHEERRVPEAHHGLKQPVPIRMQSQKLDLRFGDELPEAVLGCVDTDCSVGEQRKMSAENLKSKWRRSEHENARKKIHLFRGSENAAPE